MQAITIHAPGRINIIGEHTDYNDGWVLPAAINKGTSCTIKQTDSKHRVELVALDLQERFVFDIHDITRQPSGWQNYLLGVIAEIYKLRTDLRGFRAEFTGNVPIGSGMSSSASLECSLAVGLNRLFNLGFSDWEIIRICQAAEHHYVGTECGIMDQFASIKGKKDHAMLLDCQSLQYEYIPCSSPDYSWMLVNSEVHHSLADSEYNKRKSECLEGLSMLQVQHNNIESIRSISWDQLEQSKEKMHPKLYRRLHHVLSENQRVKTAGQALKTHQYDQLGALLYQSHRSLRDDYEVSCQELDFLVDCTRDWPHVLGSRMMGGGFGGCTINLVQRSMIADFKRAISQAYLHNFDIPCTMYEISIENGASEL